MERIKNCFKTLHMINNWTFRLWDRWHTSDNSESFISLLLGIQLVYILYSCVLWSTFILGSFITINYTSWNDQTYFFQFFHQRQEVSPEQLSFGLADDWLREDCERDMKFWNWVTQYGNSVCVCVCVFLYLSTLWALSYPQHRCHFCHLRNTAKASAPALSASGWRSEAEGRMKACFGAFTILCLMQRGQNTAEFRPEKTRSKRRYKDSVQRVCMRSDTHTHTRLHSHTHR